MNTIALRLLFLLTTICLVSGFTSASEKLNVVVEGLISGDDSTQAERIANSNAIRTAIRNATKQKIGKIVFPSGRFHFEGASEHVKSIELSSNLWLQGSGREATTLVFHPTEPHLKGPPPPGSVGFLALGCAGIQISDIGFENIGSKSVYDKAQQCYIPQTQSFANTIALLLTDCVRCRIENCSFKFGQNGLKFDNTTDKYEVNQQITVSDCLISDTAGYGLELVHASSTIIENNHFSRCGSDGMKTRRFCRWLTIGRNISRENGRDGFDFYDGLLESTVTGNVARGNHLQGFDIKGNFDNEAKQYASRENTFSANIATRNGHHGFTIQQVRNSIFNGNQASLNNLSGFLLNGLQNCVLTGQQASKNTGHGFYITSMSRSTITGCMAIDNGWTDGSRIPDDELTYSGFFLEPPADGIVFSGCVALNGTLTNQQGNQKHGIFFASYSEPVEKRESGDSVLLRFEAGSSEGNILTGGNYSRNRIGQPGRENSGLGGNISAQQKVNCN